MRQPAISNVDEPPSTPSTEIELQVRLAGGIGVSVINTVPEELVYGTLDQIEVRTLYQIESTRIKYY